MDDMDFSSEREFESLLRTIISDTSDLKREDLEKFWMKGFGGRNGRYPDNRNREHLQRVMERIGVGGNLELLRVAEEFVDQSRLIDRNYLRNQRISENMRRIENRMVGRFNAMKNEIKDNLTKLIEELKGRGCLGSEFESPRELYEKLKPTKNNSFFSEMHQFGSNRLPQEENINHPNPNITPFLEPSSSNQMTDRRNTNAISTDQIIWDVPETSSPSLSLSPSQLSAFGRGPVGLEDERRRLEREIEMMGQKLEERRETMAKEIMKTMNMEESKILMEQQLAQIRLEMRQRESFEGEEEDPVSHQNNESTDQSVPSSSQKFTDDNNTDHRNEEDSNQPVEEEQESRIPSLRSVMGNLDLNFEDLERKVEEEQQQAKKIKKTQTSQLQQKRTRQKRNQQPKRSHKGRKKSKSRNRNKNKKNNKKNKKKKEEDLDATLSELGQYPEQAFEEQKEKEKMEEIKMKLRKGLVMKEKKDVDKKPFLEILGPVLKFRGVRKNELNEDNIIQYFSDDQIYAFKALKELKHKFSWEETDAIFNAQRVLDRFRKRENERKKKKK